MLPALHFSDQSESFLVTGATGFIGQQLVRALLADGQRVTILTRNPKHADVVFKGKVHCIRSLQNLPANYVIDIIINLAGARILGWHWTKKRKAVLRDSRVALTDGIVAWTKTAEKRPRLLLSASAIGYYGLQNPGDERCLTEDSPPQDIFMSQLCQEWEAAAQTARQVGVRVVRMRFGIVLGHQGALPMMLMPIRLGMGGTLGGGRQWQSWIHVHDVLKGIAHLCTFPAPDKFHISLDEVFNFTAPDCVTQKQFSQIAAHILHRPCFIPTPAWLIRLVLGEQADLLLDGQRVAPNRLLEQKFEFSFPDLKSALTNLQG